MLGNDLIDLGVTERVDNSDEDTESVPALKENADLCIGGDYGVTINRHLVDFKYSFSRIDEIRIFRRQYKFY